MKEQPYAQSCGTNLLVVLSRNTAVHRNEMEEIRVLKKLINYVEIFVCLF